jgi:hypothetical protein
MELIQSSVKYAFNFKPQRSHKVERGVVEVLDAPTGFMMIKKDILRRMIAHYPEVEYMNDVQAYQINKEDRFYDLFPSQIFEGRYLSEDYGFCRLWQRMGGEIFTDLTVKLNHIGQFCYFGDPIQFLKHSNAIQLSENKPPETTSQNTTPAVTTSQPIADIIVPEIVEDPVESSSSKETPAEWN